eukprot:TRINITY_DN8502_c0_g1_i1.p1 TRINITY_DN8502_c0_g1~~TRINITY_DN8502_c0_g1_i1.p1  ORF type:complete len:215 (-),score=50.86 TRINITY_DN8502_c0_g1_i1:9-653(-)
MDPTKKKKANDKKVHIKIVCDEEVPKLDFMSWFITGKTAENGNFRYDKGQFASKTIQCYSTSIIITIDADEEDLRLKPTVNNAWRRASAIIVMYSVFDKNTFSNATNWIKEVQSFGRPGACFCLIGLLGGSIKKQKREVTKSEGKALASENKLTFFFEVDIDEDQDSAIESSIEEIATKVLSLTEPVLETPTEEHKPTLQIDTGTKPKRKCVVS